MQILEVKYNKNCDENGKGYFIRKDENPSFFEQMYVL